MLFDCAFEYEQYGSCIGVAYDIVAVHVGHRRTLVGVRGNVDDEFHYTFRADVAFRRCAEDRHPFAFCDTHTDTLANVVRD